MSEGTITKTYLYNFDPLKPHFYIVKLRFTGVYIIFLISAQKHRFARRFERVPTIYVLSRNMKNIRVFYLKFFSFFEVKFCIYLNRRGFLTLLYGKVWGLQIRNITLGIVFTNVLIFSWCLRILFNAYLHIFGEQGISELKITENIFALASPKWLIGDTDKYL